MSSVLVTGATGFIGQHLVKRLKQLNFVVFEENSRSGDVVDAATWCNYPVADVVVHLASKSFVPESWEQPSQYINCNLLGTTEALNYCKKNKAKLIFLSSYMYGNPEYLPIDEEAKVSVNNPYALSKKLAEDVCKFYSDNFEIPVVILRPFNIYGTGQAGHFLVPMLIKQILEGLKVEVKDLDPKRDYVYIDDVINAIVSGIEYKAKFAIFNIGFGKSYSVKALIACIMDVLKVNVPVTSNNEKRKGEILDCFANVDLAKKELKWQPSFDLTCGIEAMINSTVND